MNKLAFIFSLFGSLLGAYQGTQWLVRLGTLDSHLGVTAKSQGIIAVQLLQQKNATYTLLVSALVGLVFAFVVLMLKGFKLMNCIALILAGFAPLFFSIQAYSGIPMAIGGLFASYVTYDRKRSAYTNLLRKRT